MTQNASESTESLPACENSYQEGKDDYLVVEHLTKRFGKTEAIKDVSFSVGQRKIVTLLGPSGCGKSTTLRCVAGLETIDKGRIMLNGKVVTSAEDHISVPPEKRDIGMVFQSYAVWPHMTVWGNVAYPLQIQKVKKDEIDRRVNDILALVGLQELASRNVTKLSGGQQQRVVLARAMVHNPSILLFDEPLSNLDARLRVSMRFEIRRLQQKIGIAALYVTHDQSEAMVISDEVIVMNQGRIEQIGRPLEIYRKPVTAFIASFFGDVNFLEGVIESPDPQASPFMPVQIQIDGRKHLLYANTQKGMKPGDKVYVCIRPQDLEIKHGAALDEDVPALEGSIYDIVHMGNHVEYYIKVGSLELCHHHMQDLGLAACDDVRISFIPERCVCVPR